MSEEKKTESTSGVSRRSMLKTTAGLVVAGAIGVGLGYGASELLRPTAPPGGVVTQTQTVATMVTAVTPVEEEEAILTSVAGEGGTPLFVHVKNGRMIRVRPMIYQEDEKSWSLNIDGKTYAPNSKSSPTPFELAYRKRTYSPLRIRYPLKRVDFDPSGERNPQNRGKSDFVRISWDEALNIVASELNRVKGKYGNSAILALTSSHYSAGSVHRPHQSLSRLLNLFGGYTAMVSNPDSWEGWYWGAEHVWGHEWSLNAGSMDQTDLLEDVLTNTKLLVFWSHDPQGPSVQYGGAQSALWPIWYRERAIKQVYITPDLNYGAGVFADTWIPIKGGTDAALALAIAYVWITEGTYEKDYVQTHAYGFDQWKDYVLGTEDNVPKTSEWAEKITGVKARVIRALAREWARNVTSMGAGADGSGGGWCRVKFATEPIRMAILLMTMQGIGKPGVSMFGSGAGGAAGAPKNPEIYYGALPIPENFESAAENYSWNPVEQKVWRLYVADAILNPPIKFHGHGVEGLFAYPPMSVEEQQFTEFTYPAPGYSPIKLIFEQGSSNIANWCETNKWVKAYQSPEIEFLVRTDAWLTGTTKFSDIILPGTTPLERNDIMTMAGDHDVTVYMKQCTQPLGDSKSEYEFFSMLAERLGIGQEFTEGNTAEDWIRKLFEKSELTPKLISFDQFKEKGYYAVKFPDEWPRNPGLQWYYQKPQGEGLHTPSGKIEFYSQRLAKQFPDDKERPPVPHYIQPPEDKLAGKYPLIVESTHPRYRFHTQHGDNAWLNEIEDGFVIHVNGYPYYTVWINPKDASARGIKYGDIVRTYNDRGQMLGAAFVTERMMPGVIRCPDGGWYDPIEPGKPGSLDRGGAVGLLSYDDPTSKNADGMVCTGFRAQVEKWSE